MESVCYYVLGLYCDSKSKCNHAEIMMRADLVLQLELDI